MCRQRSTRYTYTHNFEEQYEEALRIPFRKRRDLHRLLQQDVKAAAADGIGRPLRFVVSCNRRMTKG